MRNDLFMKSAGLRQIISAVAKSLSVFISCEKYDKIDRYFQIVAAAMLGLNQNQTF